jgi:thiazole synthase ThiGH ThiG subunit
VQEWTAELAPANAELRLDEARFEALFHMSQMVAASEQEIITFALRTAAKPYGR